MKLLIVGAGSIGSRHARNARDRVEVLLYDADPQRTAEMARATGVRPCADLEEALALRPEAAIVATPHADHVPSGRRLVEAGCHVLLEKPIADRVEPARQLVRLAAKKNRRLFVVCNMRFHPGPANLMAHLPEIGTPWFARAHFGQWLPDMRPQADYRRLYSARREAGGGVVLDAIHEIDYLSWLFGPVTAAAGTSARRSDLEIDVEDYAALNLRHEGGVRSEIHLDFLQACKRRGCEIVGNRGTLLWESEGTRPERCRVRLYRAEEECWVDLYESADVEADAMYRSLLDHFFAAVRGNRDLPLLEGAAALRELAVALAVKENDALTELDYE